ncbi:MAG: SRPBCC family protein [Solirubrobacterales bacterium]
MQLTDQFTVPVAVDQLWEVLNDVERIAPCVPGFTLAEANHPEYRGRMRVKVGAITVSYDATIRFVERDEAARRVVLAVSGREVRGAGSVDATVTSTLQGDDHRTTAEMVTDVNVTGRVAQFGRGIIADVSSRMTEQFVERLNARVLAPPAAPQAPHAASATQGAADRASTASRPAPAAPPAEEPLDLGSVAAVPVLKRIAPVVAGLALVALVAWLWRRRR